MYMLSRKYSFTKPFFLLCFIGLALYTVIAFHTLTIGFITSSKDVTIKKPLHENSIQIGKRNLTPITLKYILLWTKVDTKLNYAAKGQRIFIKNSCKYANCYITTERTLLGNDIKKFDAILFSVTTLRNWIENMPKERSIMQKYIFYSMLPSTEYPVCDVNADNFFNWTWTYKLYSDISTPFIEVIDLKGNRIAPNIDVDWDINSINFNHISNNSGIPKAKTMMWYNENCAKANQNSLFAMELQAHMKEHRLDLDMFGCNMTKCHEGGCLKAIETSYSFYLVIEESVSEDFVSKEVLKAYQHNAVPVIFGGADYSKFLPPESYINARLESPAELAGLIEYTIRNPSIYKKYFTWNNYYTITEANIETGYCDLCELLNDGERMKTGYYESFRNWWYYGNLKYKCYAKSAQSDEVLSLNSNSEQERF